MNLLSNSARYEPYKNQLNNSQNNQLLYNSYNNIQTPTNNILNQNVMVNPNNLYNSVNITSKSNNSLILSQNNNINLQRSFNRKLSSSGILKASTRNKKFDKVLKNGKKLKNIDINRDYEDKPDDDLSTNVGKANNFANKLISLNKKNSNNNSNSKENINLLKPNNNLDIKKSNTNYLISKQNELNITSNNPNNSNNVFNINISTLPPPIPMLNLDLNENNQYQPFEQINSEIIYPPFSSDFFKSCCLSSKPGKSIDGSEKTNQDTPLVCTSVGGIEGFNIFGVLDGHGSDGHFVSQFFKNYFINKMSEYVEYLSLIAQIETAEDIYINLKSGGFSNIIDLYTNADNELLTQNSFDCSLAGTTCDLIFQFNSHLICFNVGDSRSILIEDSGNFTNQIIRPLSRDHKPNLPDEYKRIQECGGTVERIKDYFGNELGPYRVFKAGTSFPGLAMSRSLGDFQAKECGVISTPEVVEYEKNINTKFLVVCSDGVWEYMSNEIVRDIGNKYYPNLDIQGFCNELITTSINLWGQQGMARDDITAVAVFF